MTNRWHYQLMRHTDADTGEIHYAVHEYYPEDELLNDLWTFLPVVVDGDSVEEVKEVLRAMLEDIEKHGVKDYT